MSKFENKVAELNTEALTAMRDDLKQRVESGSLSFGRKALNLLKAVAAGILASDTITIGYDQLAGNKQLYPVPGLVTASTIATLANGTERRSSFADPASKKILIMNATCGLGFAIGGTLLLNSKSRKNDAKELSFVEQELARREQKSVTSQQSL